MLRHLVRGLASRRTAPWLHVRGMSSGTSGQKLEGKVAIVTASTEGIGLAIARRLAQDGAKVMVSSRDQKKVDAAVRRLVSEDLPVAGVTCHVSSNDDRARLVEETVRQFGGVDILVSNAATNPCFGPMMETSEEAWDKIFDTNVKASFMLCKETVPHMQQRGGGAIVMVSSIAAYVPLEMIGAYSVSKTALLGLVKALSAELVSSNIRVNGLSPGLIKTTFSKALWSNEQISKDALAKIGMGRYGNPEECAGTVSFLVSDDASYLTGETIAVTGGMPSRL